MFDKDNLEILIDESSVNILFEELNKFIKFYGLEMGISSRNLSYRFFTESYDLEHIFSKSSLFCDIGFIENNHERLLTKEEFELNILIMGQFLFTSQDSGKYRPHDLGMNKSHVSFLKGCFRGQEVIARTEHLSKKKKKIMPIKFEDESSISSKKIKTLKEISLNDNIFKLISFVPN